MSTTVTQPTAPSNPPYPIPPRMLHSLTLALPRPAAEEPATAWQQTVQAALDNLDVLNPRNALEAFLAIQFIALGTAALDACRLAFEAGASAVQARHHRASAAGLTRSMTGLNRMLAAQRLQSPAAGRDWGETAAEQAALWQATPARPPESAHTGKAADDTPATIVKWMDELEDAEVAIAIEQERRQKAGEPPLPRKPGQPIVVYSYKPTDYVYKFKPDPKNFQKYPGWENMTMAERREFFGYTYTGPNGPPEALTPASRDEMLKQIEIEKLLDAEYGPRLDR